jgi:(1->4)-alpha-D-glucan 1-alpha-D-glucosylmutase
VYLIPDHIPVSTYRLQFGPNLRFAQACELVEYLAALGIGAAYASPLVRAREHSTHGYDVVDHRQIDPALGTDEDFRQLAESLQQHGLGLMMDVVPNHMGIDDPNNLWWQDLLENGRSSVYSNFFDVDWDPPKDALKQKVLLPILGEQYGRALENQELQIVWEDQRLKVAYHERRFPLAPRTWADVLRLALETVAVEMSPDDPDRMELESIATALDNLPPQDECDPELVQQRYREKEVARRRLAALVEISAAIRDALTGALRQLNGRQHDPRSFDRLEQLLSRQPYRLAYWRVATDEINYRRFFDINELAAIRVEDPEVFEAVHALQFEFIRRGWVTALRVDHPDGLLDPQQYFENLQNAYRQLGQTPDAPPPGPPASFYIAVEKILAHDETLCAAWPVNGTTGYDFLNLLNGLFVHREGAVRLRQCYARFIDAPSRFADVLYASKKTILNVSMSSELHVLAGQLDRISEQHRWSRDFTRTSLRRALREVIACFPVYRTYIRPGESQPTEDDRRRIATAIRFAKRRNPEMSSAFFDFIASVLLLEDPDGLSDEEIAMRRDFVFKFQQVTGPVTAKGVEDTAFYRDYPLASLNEVGGDPAIPGVSLDQFHRRNIERHSAWPFSMLATATHDTKRGEDTRARLNVLAEMPDEWAEIVAHWSELNASRQIDVDGAMAPDKNEEYLLYQTLLGIWPLTAPNEATRSALVERILQYLDKAFKEAKVHTSWLNPNQEHDAAVANFARTILDPAQSPEFLHELTRLVDHVASAGFTNSLAQTLIKIAAPGVPDFYQGTELWDFSLVDPDNRRPVDFGARQALLSELDAAAESNLNETVRGLLAAWPDPRVKVFVVSRALRYRRAHADLFLRGGYVPLNAEGSRAEHVCAFARQHEGRHVVCVTPRFTLAAWREANASPATGAAGWRPAAWWRGTTLRLPAEMAAECRDCLTERWVGASQDRAIDVADVLAQFPVALLEG